MNYITIETIQFLIKKMSQVKNHNDCTLHTIILCNIFLIKIIKFVSIVFIPIKDFNKTTLTEFNIK